MIVTYNQAKNARNLDERGISFELAGEFDFRSAIYVVDQRHEYNEQRIRATGRIRNRLHVLAYVTIPGGIRVISLRKANAREVRRYEAQAGS